MVILRRGGCFMGIMSWKWSSDGTFAVGLFAAGDFAGEMKYWAYRYSVTENLESYTYPFVQIAFAPRNSIGRVRRPCIPWPE